MKEVSSFSATKFLSLSIFIFLFFFPFFLLSLPLSFFLFLSFFQLFDCPAVYLRSLYLSRSHEANSPKLSSRNVIFFFLSHFEYNLPGIDFHARVKFLDFLFIHMDNHLPKSIYEKTTLSSLDYFCDSIFPSIFLEVICSVTVLLVFN